MSFRADIKPLPSQGRLRELLTYDKRTGELRWKVKPITSRSNICFNNKCGGKVAGTITQGREAGDNKYLVVSFRVEDHGKQTAFLASRIIWKMVTGKDPNGMVDHVDGDTLNNRWTNFRIATNGQNIQNSKLRSDNISGVKGISWDEQHKKWRAVISANGKSVRLGRFTSISEAETVIVQARLQLHGDFARLT